VPSNRRSGRSVDSGSAMQPSPPNSRCSGPPAAATEPRSLCSVLAGVFARRRRGETVVVAVAVYLVSFYICVSIFSDGAESEARWKILAIALLATLLLNGISSASPTLLGLGLACLAAAIVCLAGLIFWIKVTRPQALKIATSYIGFVLAHSVVIGLIFHALGAHAA
jgi:hypothetical protein